MARANKVSFARPRHLAAGHLIPSSFTIRWPLHHLLHALLPGAAVTWALKDFRINLTVLQGPDFLLANHYWPTCPLFWFG